MSNLIKKYQRKQRINFADLRKATPEELGELQMLVNTDIAIIGSQLLEAKALVHTKKEYSDPEWFAKATRAKKFKGQLSQGIQMELGRRKKENQQKNNLEQQTSFANCLLKAMDDFLSPEVKSTIIEKAQKIEIIGL